MVKKNTPTNKGNLFGILRQLISEPVTLAKTKLGTDTENSISTTEKDKVVKRIADATRTPMQRRATDAYTKYLHPMAKKITGTRLDAQAIEILAPEVKTAREIVIPSIISPTDMRDGEIAFLSTSSMVSADINERISKILSDHFNITEKLSRKLPNWIHESLYGAGAQPIMVVPITEIDTIINDPSAVLTTTKLKATENLDTLFQSIEKKTLFGIADSAHIKVPLLIDEVKPAIESLITEYHKVNSETSGETRLYDLNKLWSDNNKRELYTYMQGAIEQISIVDNPDILKSDKSKKNLKTAEMTSKVANIYKTTTTITINPESKKSIGDPVVYELPPESVIPIFTPGTPTDHIGYFILLDEFGNPIHMAGEGPITDLTDNKQVTPTSLYKTFGLDNPQAFKTGSLRTEQSELMMNVYQTIVESHLKNRLKNSGLSNIYIGAPTSVYRCMFARYLALRQTKLLFVPKDLVTYICFKHNADGTGRSKIEDIKFILSLKITILVCRVMAAMNSSINRRKLTVNFTENMGDPIAFFEQLKKEAIDKSVTNFTYDPNEITRTLAQKSLSISAKGIPGAENYDITSEPNEYRDIKPDESLMEDLSNLLILGLDVPPSAFNMLGENEFSRSIATNNLFFCRRISAYQRLICEKIANHAQIYTSMSETLKAKIRNVLSEKKESLATEAKKSSDLNNQNDSGTIDENKNSIDVKLDDVIKNIIAVLPSPNIAPSKTEFEELDTIINSINTAIEAAFDNDAGSTDDNPMPMIRSLIKESVVRDYMTKIGVMRDVKFPDLTDPEFLEKIHARKLQLINLSTGLKQAVAVTTQNTTTDMSNSSNPTF